MDTKITEAEHWLAAITTSSDDAIIGMSPDRVVRSWNHSAERIFGYSASEAIGQPIHALLWPELQDGMGENSLPSAHAEPVQHVETIRRHKDGREILVCLSASPITDAGGRTIGIVEIARDLTDRVELEQSLTASSARVRFLTEQEALTRISSLAERRFRELIENAPDGILQVNREGKIILTNRTAEMLFGYTREEMLQLQVEDLVPEAHRAGHAERRANFAKAGVSRPMGLGLNLSARRKDGSGFPAEISLSPISTADGVNVTAVIRNVTERKRTEEQVRTLQESYMAELEARQKEAERLNHLKNEFLASVSHELRTPLHTIIGFTDLLNEELEGPLNPTQKEFVQHIHRDSEHLLGLINDVLDLSRIESGGLTLHTESLSLRDSMQEAVSAIQSHAEAKSIDVSSDDPGNLLVIADPVRLRQIFYNLLSNAVKFTPAGGKVTVHAQPNGASVQITVADTGVGIPLEEQKRIFERFYQVGRTTSGTGLGLAICKQLVEMQGGTISVDSQPGHGSRFHFDLPMAQV